jgi:ABC-type nitrate/sulfonate/bicarbonate transport system substrate-binding protein
MTTRRAFLQGSLLAGIGLPLGTSLLSACGGSSAPAAGGGKSLTPANYQLAWIKNFEFVGSYIATEKGYYKDEGLDVNLVAGGTTTNFETEVVSKKAFVATSYAELTGAAVSEGAPVVIIGTIYQKSPYAIISRADAPIKAPKDMVGRKIGLNASTQSAFDTFCAINKIDPKSCKQVPVEVDPAPLASGEVDGWLGYVMDEPSTLRSRGVAVDTLSFSDFGFYNYASVYVVRRDSLKDKRDEVKAFMRAEIRGWQDAIADPALAAQLTIDTFGKDLGLNAKAQTLAAAAQNKIVVTDDPSRGILTLDPKVLPLTIPTLKGIGVTTTVDALYDTTVMDEIYDGKTRL